MLLGSHARHALLPLPSLRLASSLARATCTVSFGLAILSDLLGRFYQAWRALLSDACGDTALADEAIGSSMEFLGTVPGRAI